MVHGFDSRWQVQHFWATGRIVHRQQMVGLASLGNSCIVVGQQMAGVAFLGSTLGQEVQHALIH